MTLTLEELKSRLAQQFDEVTLLELLGVTSEELVEAFEDRIENNFSRFAREVY